MLNFAQAIDKHPDLRYNNIVVDETFLSSSMAEHSAVNRRVVGSSPTWGAIGLDILAISSPFFVGNKVPYARLTPSFESGYLNEKHMQTTCIDKSP